MAASDIKLCIHAGISVRAHKWNRIVQGITAILDRRQQVILTPNCRKTRFGNLEGNGLVLRVTGDLVIQAGTGQGRNTQNGHCDQQHEAYYQCNTFLLLSCLLYTSDAADE